MSSSRRGPPERAGKFVSEKDKNDALGNFTKTFQTAIFNRPYWDVIKGTLPFFAILLLMSVLLVCFPGIALMLRDLATL